MSDRVESSAAGLGPAAFRRLRWRWGGYGVATVVLAIVLTVISQWFGYETEVIEMPSLILAGLLVLGGIGFAVAVPSLIGRSKAASRAQQSALLSVIVSAGLIARLLFFLSEPMLENDYQRYLWDGAVTAHGHNPYAASPLSVSKDGRSGELGLLAIESGETLQRIGHKSLTTIYPPVAQGAFAIAHFIKPWSLSAWRSVLLICDLATLYLLLALLDATARSRLWSAVYWLNPVVLKEIFNSAHMEAIVAPLVLLALLSAGRCRPLLATVFLGLAAGAKLWPALLVPLIWRPLLNDWRRLAAAVVIFGTLMVLWLAPMITGGFGEASGLAAYVELWNTNSALFPALEQNIEATLRWAGLANISAAFVAKGLIGMTLATLALAQARHPLQGVEDLIARSSLLIAALVLLSPAQYPWYTVWFAPFLVFWPSRGLLLLSATLPLYYLSFHLAARDAHEIFTSYVVWVIWAPVWTVLAWDFVHGRRADTPIASTSMIRDC